MNRWAKFIHLLLTSALVCTQAVQAQMIRGTPGVDYPDYPSIPATSFRCSDQAYNPGFFADPETQCQVFHFCFNHRHESFLCPAGTIFNQAILACDSWYTSNCSMAPMFYSVNIGPVLEKAGKDIPMLLKLRDRAGINFQPSVTTENVLDPISSHYETSSQSLESSDVAVSDNRVDDRTLDNPEIEEPVLDSGNESDSTGHGFDDNSYNFPQNDQTMDANDEYHESEYQNLNEENPWGQMSYPDEIQAEVFFDGTNYYSYDQPQPDYDWKDSQPSDEFRTFYEDYADRFQSSFDGSEDGYQEVNEIAESQYVTESLYEGENESDEILVDPMQEFSKRLLQRKRRNTQYVVLEEEPEEQIPTRSRVTRPSEQEYELLSDLEELVTELPLKLENKPIDETKTSEDFQFIEIPDEPEGLPDSVAPEQPDSNEQGSYESIPGEQSILLPDGQETNSYGEDNVKDLQNEDPSVYTDEMEDGYVTNSNRFDSRQEFKDLPRWPFERVRLLSEGSAEENYQRKMALKAKRQHERGFMEIPDETEDETFISGAGSEFSDTEAGENYNFVYSGVDQETPENDGESVIYETVYAGENDNLYNPNPANYYAVGNNPYPSQFESVEYSPEFWQNSLGPGQVNQYIPPYYTSDESQLKDFQPTGEYEVVQAEVPGFEGMDSVDNDLESQSEIPDNRDSFNGYYNPYAYGYYMPDVQADDYRNYYDSQSGYFNGQVYDDSFSENTGYSYELGGSSNFVGSSDSEDAPAPGEQFDHSVENLETEEDGSLSENNEAFSDVQSDESPNADPEFRYQSNDFLEVPGNFGLNYGKENDDILYVFDFDPEDQTSDSQISEGASHEDKSFETLDESLELEDSNLQNEDKTVASNMANHFSTVTLTEANINDTSIEGKMQETVSVESEKDEKPVTLSSAVKHLSGLKSSTNLPQSEKGREDFTPPSENRLLNSMFPNQMNFNPYMYGGNMGQFGMMDSSNTVPFSRSGSVQMEQSGQQAKPDLSKLSSIQEKLRSMKRGKFGVFKKFIKSNP